MEKKTKTVYQDWMWPSVVVFLYFSFMGYGFFLLSWYSSEVRPYEIDMLNMNNRMIVLEEKVYGLKAYPESPRLEGIDEIKEDFYYHRDHVIHYGRVNEDIKRSNK